MSKADKMLLDCGWLKYSESDFFIKYRKKGLVGEVVEIHIGKIVKKVYRSFCYSDLETEIAIVHKLNEMGWLGE